MVVYVSLLGMFKFWLWLMFLKSAKKNHYFNCITSFLQFFWMVTDTYREGTLKEMKKWSYEIYSTFLAERAVCIAFWLPMLFVIDHFTVVFLVTWPLNGNEPEGDLVLIQTLLLLLCKSSCSYANYMSFTWEKQRGLYQNKVTSSLACIHGQVTKNTTVEWSIVKY